MAFSYKDYIESDTLNKARQALDKHESNKVADWTGGTYGEVLKEALGKIQNREKFSYDLNGDALYNQYKDRYMTQGKLAMQDTMGQAAALTGGYGNSYASTVGNQAYQGYLQKLNDVVPELYQMAYDRYRQEGQDLKDNYALISDMYSREYNEDQAKRNEWYNERNYLADKYNADREYDYNQYADGRNFAFSGYQQEVSENQWQKSFDESQRQFEQDLALQKARDAESKRQYEQNLAYQKARDAVADSQWQKQYNLSVANSKKKSSVSSSGGAISKLKEVSPKIKNIISESGSRAVVAKPGNNSRLFESCIMTRDEFESRKASNGEKVKAFGKTVTNYTAYVDAALEYWTNESNSKLSDSEIAYLYDKYKL